MTEQDPRNRASHGSWRRPDPRHDAVVVRPIRSGAWSQGAASDWTIGYDVGSEAPDQ